MIARHRRLDPRSKLAFVAVVAALAVALPRVAPLAALGAVLLAVVASARDVGARRWASYLWVFRYLLPVIFVLNTAFYAGGATLWRLRDTPIAVTEGGLTASTVIALRLLVVAGIAAWFAETTDPEEFEVTLTSLGVPWRLAFMVSLTLRLAPEMRVRFREIEEAQRSRGLRIAGGPISRARARLPMFVPFLASAVQYGYELSDALTVRDFGAAERRTSVVSLDHGRGDYALYALSAAVLAGFLGWFVA